jgi:hypothetical protein
MPQRDTPVRSLHDIGLAAWFDGSLMGAVELNGAAATVKGPKERISVATTGWKHWAPVQMAPFVAVGIGGAVLILVTRPVVLILAAKQRGQQRPVAGRMELITKS